MAGEQHSGGSHADGMFTHNSSSSMLNILWIIWDTMKTNTSDCHGCASNLEFIGLDEISKGSRLTNTDDVLRFVIGEVFVRLGTFLAGVLDSDFGVMGDPTASPYYLLTHYWGGCSGAPTHFGTAVNFQVAQRGTLQWNDFKPDGFPGLPYENGTPLLFYDVAENLAGTAVDLVRRSKQYATETGTTISLIFGYDSAVCIDYTHHDAPKFAYFSRDEGWIAENLDHFFDDATATQAEKTSVFSFFFWSMGMYLLNWEKGSSRRMSRHWSPLDCVQV